LAPIGLHSKANGPTLNVPSEQKNVRVAIIGMRKANTSTQNIKKKRIGKSLSVQKKIKSLANFVKAEEKHKDAEESL
jgi:hypothetical protein